MADKEHLDDNTPGVDPDYLLELSKHLRAIYYLLVLGTAAIVLATTALPERSLSRAIAQLEALISWTDNWQDDWLEVLSAETLSTLQSQYNNWPAPLPSQFALTLNPHTGRNLPSEGQSRPLTTHLQFFGNSWTLRGGGGYLADSPRPELQSSVVTMDAFNTIEQAAALWTSLASGPRVNWLSLPPNPIGVLLSPARDNRPDPIVGQLIVDPSQHDSTGAGLRLVPIDEEVKRLIGTRLSGPMLGRGAIHNALVEQQELTHAWFVPLDDAGRYLDASHPLTYDKGLRLHIPLRTFRVTLDAQRWLLDHRLNANGLNLAEGDFEYTFSDLYQHSRGLEELPLRQLKQFLDKGLLDAASDVQAFGLTFKGGALGSWGMAILGALQLYFVVSFRQLVALRQRIAWNFPWLALYNDRLSDWLFRLSAFVFPTGVVLFLGFENLSQETTVWLSVATALGLTTSVIATVWGLSLSTKLAFAAASVRESPSTSR